MTTTDTAQTPDFTAIKQVQQQTWSSGDYASVAARIQTIADRLVEAAEIPAGSRVLDVATGSGNAAIAAARYETSVVGIDYVPSLLDVARQRASAERLDIEFREGDAEELPVETASFDAVISVVGTMFAPDHQRTADELVRACRPGGTIALASWNPTSFIARLFKVVTTYAPPPAGLVSPMAWGDEAHLQQLFGDRVTDLRSTERSYTWRFRTAEDFVTFFERHYGPTHKAFGRLDHADRNRMADDLVELIRSEDTSGDGASVAVPATYLETTCHRV